MSERCLTLGCPEAIRLSLEDPCTGETICGDEGGYVVSCIRNWSIEPIVREGEASEFVADCGNMVIRDRQDDQLLGYTISFETSARSNELEALVTSKELIPSTGLNIGTYSSGSNLGCTTPSADPRLMIEAFYKLSRCVSGANHVRVVLPLAQFKVTELDREGTITFYRYTAETGTVLANALGDGPFGDFPADIVSFLAGRDPDEYTTGLDFEENISISGSCGFVPTFCGPGFFLTTDVPYEAQTDPASVGVDIATDAQGRYYVASNVDPGGGGTPTAAVWRFTSNGLPDPTWGVSGVVLLDPPAPDAGNSFARSVAVNQTTGDVFVAIDSDDPPAKNYIAKLDSSGALDISFDTDGWLFITPWTPGSRFRGLFVESTGNIVAAMSEISVPVSAVFRYTPTGVYVAAVGGGNYIYEAFAYVSDGIYVASTSSLASGTPPYIAEFNFITSATTEISYAPDQIYPDAQGALGITVDPVSGDIFVVGTTIANTGFVVIKFNSAYVLQSVNTIMDGSWILAEATTVTLLSGGDMIITGESSVDGVNLVATSVRVDSSFVLVPTYGIGGIAYPTVDPNAPVLESIRDSIISNAGSKIVNTGAYQDGAAWRMYISRILASSGSLDTSFG